MESVYGSEWQTEEKSKRQELVSPEACYLFVYESSSTDANRVSELVEARCSYKVDASDKDPIVAFVQYRFTLEEEIPVLYVYELQLEPHVQGMGLGKFLMQLIELIAREVMYLSKILWFILYTPSVHKKECLGTFFIVQKRICYLKYKTFCGFTIIFLHGVVVYNNVLMIFRRIFSVGFIFTWSFFCNLQFFVNHHNVFTFTESLVVDYRYQILSRI